MAINYIKTRWYLLPSGQNTIMSDGDERVALDKPLYKPQPFGGFKIIYKAIVILDKTFSNPKGSFNDKTHFYSKINQ